jgi:transcriptional regulator with XRE-family HTH domain
MTMTTMDPPFGQRLREWRQFRRLSQLNLASQAEVSSRHLSFLETGRSNPSREMVVHLCEELDVPLRERNVLLGSAGFSPTYSERSLDDVEMAAALEVLNTVLEAHEPYPAVVVDGNWNLLRANAASTFFLTGIPAHLLEPTINIVRLSMHPDGLAPMILNYGEYAEHMIARLQRQLEHDQNPELGALLTEIRAYADDRGADPSSQDPSAIMLPLNIRLDDLTELSLVSTISVFGAPNDVTLDELAVEAFYPADEITREWFHRQVL